MGNTRESLLFGLIPPSRGARYPELLHLHQPDSRVHLVQFYEDEARIAGNVAYLSATTLGRGDSSVVIATGRHLGQIRQQMGRVGFDPEQRRESGIYMGIDAGEALSRVMTGGEPDEAKFEEYVGGVVRRAESNSTNGFAFAFGEMVDLLSQAKKYRAALRLERLWNALMERHRFSLYCAYAIGHLTGVRDVDTLTEICGEHALMIPSEV